MSHSVGLKGKNWILVAMFLCSLIGIAAHIARIGECSTLLILMFLAKHDLPKLNPANEEMSTCFNK